MKTAGFGILSLFLLLPLISSDEVGRTKSEGLVRVEPPQYTAAGNVLSGQLQAPVSTPAGTWRIVCVSSSSPLRQNRIFPVLICNALGFENSVNIKFGQRGFGYPSSSGAVEFTSCKPGAVSLSDCTSSPTTSTCGITGYIYVSCKDILPIPVEPNADNAVAVRCDVSQKLTLQPRMTANLIFHRTSTAQECSITLAVASSKEPNKARDEYFRFLGSSDSQISPTKVPPVAAPTPCRGSYIIVVNNVPTGRPAVHPQFLCLNVKTPRTLYVSPRAESVNITLVRDNADALPDPEVTFELQATPPLFVDCNLPEITVEVAKILIAENPHLALPGSEQRYRAQVDPKTGSKECIFPPNAPDERLGDEFFVFKFPARRCGTTLTSTENNQELKMTNEILLTRTFSEPTSLIERHDAHRVPMECLMKVDKRGASTEVNDHDLGLNDPAAEIAEDIINHYQLQIFRDESYTTVVQPGQNNQPAALQHGKPIYVQIRGTIPRSEALANLDSLYGCCVVISGSPGCAMQITVDGGSAVPVDGKILRNFRFSTAILPVGRYLLTCKLSYVLQPAVKHMPALLAGTVSSSRGENMTRHLNDSDRISTQETMNLPVLFSVV